MMSGNEEGAFPMTAATSGERAPAAAPPPLHEAVLAAAVTTGKTTLSVEPTGVAADAAGGSQGAGASSPSSDENQVGSHVSPGALVSGHTKEYDDDNNDDDTDDSDDDAVRKDDAEEEHLRRLLAASKPRIMVFLLILGIINNFHYNLVISGASSLASSYGMKRLVALISFCNVALGIVARILNSFAASRISYNVRMTFMSILTMVGLVLVAKSKAIGRDVNAACFVVMLIGVSCVGCAYSYGESVALTYVQRYPAKMVGAWSSGTGLSGVIASLLFVILSATGVDLLLIFLVSMPLSVLYWLTFTFGLVSPQKVVYVIYRAPEAAGGAELHRKRIVLFRGREEDILRQTRAMCASGFLADPKDPTRTLPVQLTEPTYAMIVNMWGISWRSVPDPAAHQRHAAAAAAAAAAATHGDAAYEELDAIPSAGRVGNDDDEEAGGLHNSAGAAQLLHASAPNSPASVSSPMGLAKGKHRFTMEDGVVEDAATPPSSSHAAAVGAGDAQDEAAAKRQKELDERFLKSIADDLRPLHRPYTGDSARRRVARRAQRQSKRAEQLATMAAALGVDGPAGPAQEAVDGTGELARAAADGDRNGIDGDAELVQERHALAVQQNQMWNAAEVEDEEEQRRCSCGCCCGQAGCCGLCCGAMGRCLPIPTSLRRWWATSGPALKFIHEAAWWLYFNLFAVYVTEYFVQFMAPFSYYCSQEWKDSLPAGAVGSNGKVNSPAVSSFFWIDYSYPLSQVCYQLGVFISRSSLMVCGLRINAVGVLSIIQTINAIIWLVQAKTLFISSKHHHSAQVGLSFLLFIWMIGVGLIGGSSYVNVYYLILAKMNRLQVVEEENATRVIGQKLEERRYQHGHLAALQYGNLSATATSTGADPALTVFANDSIVVERVQQPGGVFADDGFADSPRRRLKKKLVDGEDGAGASTVEGHVTSMASSSFSSEDGEASHHSNDPRREAREEVEGGRHGDADSRTRRGNASLATGAAAGDGGNGAPSDGSTRAEKHRVIAVYKEISGEEWQRTRELSMSIGSLWAMVGICIGTIIDVILTNTLLKNTGNTC